MAETTGRKAPVLLIVSVLLVLVLGLLGAVVYLLTRQDGKETSNAETASPRLEYATEGVIFTEDPDALQKAYDEAAEKVEESVVPLSYRNVARSEDGVEFNCYVANPERARFDMFVAIYADAGMTDELYMSQLLRPGTAYDTIRLNRALPPGRHEVYAVFTTIDEEDSVQVIRGQAAVTMEFRVQ
jgi:hypothetical protein